MLPVISDRSRQMSLTDAVRTENTSHRWDAAQSYIQIRRWSTERRLLRTDFLRLANQIFKRPVG